MYAGTVENPFKVDKHHWYENISPSYIVIRFSILNIEATLIFWNAYQT